MCDKITPPDSFWVKVEKTDNCWLWRGTISNKGYGQVYVSGVTRGAHRVAYEAVRGPIPAGLQIDHLCRVRACVNPEHLDVVTNRVNTLRGTSPTAINAQKTHCIRGHPFAGYNLFVTVQGRRRCRTCQNAGARAAYRSILP